MKVIFALHGVTAWNVAELIQGVPGDPNLLPLGERQGLEIARKIQREFLASETALPLLKMMSSDLARAWKTALIIHNSLLKNGAWVLPAVYTDVRLRECHFGILEGYSWEEAKQQFGMVSADFLSAMQNYTEYDFGRYGGETSTNVLQRQMKCLADEWEKAPDGIVIIIGHGASIRTLLKHLGYADFLLQRGDIAIVEMSNEYFQEDNL